MIINPVMIRSTLKARGAHDVSPKILDVSDSYRVAALRGRIATREISAAFAGQHGNKTVGVVFGAPICTVLRSIVYREGRWPPRSPIVTVNDASSDTQSRFTAASTLHGPAPAKVKYRKTKQ